MIVVILTMGHTNFEPGASVLEIQETWLQHNSERWGTTARASYSFPSSVTFYKSTRKRKHRKSPPGLAIVVTSCIKIYSLGNLPVNSTAAS